MKFSGILFTFGLFFAIIAYSEESTIAENTQKVSKYGEQVNDVLVQNILGEFTGLDYFETKYLSLNLELIERNTTQMVQEKVKLLKKILMDREDLVKKIAEEAEKLRNASDPGPLSAKNVTFLETGSDNVTGSTVSSDESTKIVYRNAKCTCGHQLPEDVDMPNCSQPVNGYQKNPHFGEIPVSFENTSVHIPTEIYNEDQDVLKDIYLSQGIDEVMRKEVCVDSEYSNLTRWVYFTTQNGIMRFFPERKWNSDDCDLPDVYDSRLSPWYLNTVSSPKDITVLIDSSGSVVGSTLNLLNRSIHDFLATVTTNDFLNIILFNETAMFIYGKCPGLLQATPRNKQLLWKWMRNIDPKDQAFYDKGFRLTMKTLNDTLQPDVHTAKCNPLVMFFTDGDSIYPSEVLDEYNKDKSKRIFSFTVGKNFYGKEATKEIACKNRGFYDTIPFYTATKESVQYYINKLSEPLTMNKEKSVKWTLPYLDKFGLGFVITASVPVKDKNGERIAGVVGTDILLDDIKKTVIEPDMGKDYYSFIIDNNGFAIIHPNIIEANHDDVVTMDFVELEHKNLGTIREAMINGITSLRTESKELVLDKKYILTSMYQYGYAPVEGTVFKLGIGVHQSKSKSLDSVSAIKKYFPDLTWQQLVDDQKSDSTALLYSDPCPTRNTKSFDPCQVSENGTENEDSKQNFEDGLPLKDFVADSCDTASPIYSDLLLHVFLSDDLSEKQWDKNSSVMAGNGVLALYTALETPSFVRTKYFNFTEQTNGNMEKDDEIVKQEIKKILANPKDSTYMRRAIHQPEKTIYSFIEPPIMELPTEPPTTTPTPGTEATTPYQTTPLVTTIGATTEMTNTLERVKPGYILASKAVKVAASNNEIAPVVTGVVMHPDTFQKNVFSLAFKCNGRENCTSDNWDTNGICNDTENNGCLILDDGGFLLSSNQEKHFGMINKFIGLVDGELKRSLINENVFTSHFELDYQALCVNEDEVESAKNIGVPRCAVPTVADILSFGWWFSSCARMFFYSLFQNFFIGLTSFFDGGSAHLALHTGAILPSKREQCIIKTPVLYYGQNSYEHFGQFDCTDSCTRSYSVVRFKETNLMLIVVDTEAHCGGTCTINTSSPNDETDVTIEQTCKNNTRYRKPPEETCYDVRNYPEELDSPCSSAVSNLLISKHIIASALLHFVICQLNLF